MNRFLSWNKIKFIAPNILLLFGVFVLGWSAFSVLIIYWLELILSSLMVIWLLTKHKEKEITIVGERLSKTKYILSFSFFYAGLLIGMGLIIKALILEQESFTQLENISFLTIVISVLFLVGSYILQYQQIKKMSVFAVQKKAGIRMLPMFVMFFVLGAPRFAFIVLILFKAYLDVYALQEEKGKKSKV